MAGGLSIDVEEDVPLLENAPTQSLFSPGMWVQRPLSRTARAPQPRGPASPGEAEPADQRGTAAAASSGLQQRRGGLASPTADPDLAYLNIADERESAEKEYLKQDSEHMEALEAAFARLQEENRGLERQLNGVVASASDVMDENRTIKQLLAMLQVQREDFVFNPQQTIAAQQEAIGVRLMQNLEGSPPAAQLEQQQRKQAGAASLQQQQQRQQRRSAAPEAQQQQQQSASAPQQLALGPVLMDGTVLPPPMDLSPGSLLPLSTPGSFLRTVSPRIGAFRFDSTAPGEGAAGQQQQQQQAPPTVIPASPYDFPAESQIAAAALTAKQGDTAAALLTLLDKAIEGRMERQSLEQQQPAAHKHDVPAAQHGRVEVEEQQARPAEQPRVRHV